MIDQEKVDAATPSRFTTSASVRCTGTIVESQGSGQRVEMQVASVEVLGDSDPNAYPIQPKKHSLEFLRENAHLRFRTNTYSAIFRIRHQVSFGIHEYFDQQGYNYFHSPIITASDAEGADAPQGGDPAFRCVGDPREVPQSGDPACRNGMSALRGRQALRSRLQPRKHTWIDIMWMSRNCRELLLQHPENQGRTIVCHHPQEVDTVAALDGDGKQVRRSGA